MQGPTRSRTIDSFDCKAMWELNTNVRRGSLTYRQDYASYASSSIFWLQRKLTSDTIVSRTMGKVLSWAHLYATGQCRALHSSDKLGLWHFGQDRSVGSGGQSGGN